MFKNLIKILFFPVLVFMLNTIPLHAEGIDRLRNPPDYTQMMYDEIRSYVEYPQFAREQKLEGFVLVSYDYDNTGALRVLEANSNSSLLKDYVIARLSSLDLCSHARKPGKIYNLRFDFRLI